MRTLFVLIVGDLGDELDACRWWPFEIAGDPTIRHFSTMQSAATYLATHGYAPDLIVLVEQHGGRFSHKSIDELRILVPLARIWRVLGSWCEGEQRNSRPPAGCTKVYWHQCQARLARELAAGPSRLTASWGLPLTATPDERLLWEDRQPLPTRASLIAICADRREPGTALADACRSGGYRTTILSSRQLTHIDEALAVIWDCDVRQIGDAGRVSELRAAVSGAPLVAIVGFPRPEDTQHALDAGIAAIVSKPFLLRDLLWQLDEVAHRERARAA